MRRKKEFVLVCSCGCGNAFLFTADEELYVSSLSSNFYTKQEGVLHRLKKMFRLLFTGDRHLDAEVIAERKDLENFCAFLKEAQVSSITSMKPTDNVSRLHVRKEAVGCSLNLCLSMPWKDILAGRSYRGYELVLNRRQAGNLLKRIMLCMCK